MKLVIQISILALFSFGSTAAFADEVIFANSTDLSAFDNMVKTRKVDRTQKKQRRKTEKGVQLELQQVLATEKKDISKAKSNAANSKGGGSDAINLTGGSPGGRGNSDKTPGGKAKGHNK